MMEHQTHEDYSIQKLNMTEHKTDKNITEKLNSTSTAEYRTTMDNIEKLLRGNTKQNTTTLW